MGLRVDPLVVQLAVHVQFLAAANHPLEDAAHESRSDQLADEEKQFGLRCCVELSGEVVALGHHNT